MLRPNIRLFYLLYISTNNYQTKSLIKHNNVSQWKKVAQFPARFLKNPTINSITNDKSHDFLDLNNFSTQTIRVTFRRRIESRVLQFREAQPVQTRVRRVQVQPRPNPGADHTVSRSSLARMHASVEYFHLNELRIFRCPPSRCYNKLSYNLETFPKPYPECCKSRCG